MRFFNAVDCQTIPFSVEQFKQQQKKIVLEFYKIILCFHVKTDIVTMLKTDIYI